MNASIHDRELPFVTTMFIGNLSDFWKWVGHMHRCLIYLYWEGSIYILFIFDTEGQDVKSSKEALPSSRALKILPEVLVWDFLVLHFLGVFDFFFTLKIDFVISSSIQNAQFAKIYKTSFNFLLWCHMAKKEYALFSYVRN